MTRCFNVFIVCHCDKKVFSKIILFSIFRLIRIINKGNLSLDDKTYKIRINKIRINYVKIEIKESFKTAVYIIDSV